MIKEALEQRVEELVTGWCMCGVGHGYGWLGARMDGGGGWHACGTRPRGLITCWEMPEYFPNAT